MNEAVNENLLTTLLEDCEEGKIELDLGGSEGLFIPLWKDKS